MQAGIANCRQYNIPSSFEVDHGNRQSRLPITPEILRHIKEYWEEDQIDRDRVMLWAAFMLCFFSFMQSGELCCTTGGAFSSAQKQTHLEKELHDIAISGTYG